MQHPAHFRRTLFREKPQGVLTGGAAMDDEGLAQLTGRSDVDAEPVLLAGGAIRALVIIQPGFAQRDYPRCTAERGQFSHGGRPSAILARMNAHR